MTQTETATATEQKQPGHNKELPRLNRIAGQIEGVKKMIEEERYCPDILTQLRAVRSAIRAVEANLLEAHLRACVTTAFQAATQDEKHEKIGELKEIYKRFEE
jgi:CsoR family transcriptional regulator, copper-sensing transcriptional repressor